MKHTTGGALASALCCIALSSTAGEVDVVDAKVRCTEQRMCEFRVTLRHADEGWEHYANRWEILAPDGEVLATRTLRHPHVDEQPFTRALRGVKVPADLEEVRIRAHDLEHAYGGTAKVLRLPASPEPEA